MKFALCVSLLLCIASGSARAEDITLKALVGDLTSLEKLTRFPSPSYLTKQSSSYDPASKSPADKEAWFANGDCGHYIRVEKNGGREEFVMLDAAGPGAVVRIWSANPEGTLRMYIDLRSQGDGQPPGRRDRGHERQGEAEEPHVRARFHPAQAGVTPSVAGHSTDGSGRLSGLAPAGSTRSSAGSTSR